MIELHPLRIKVLLLRASDSTNITGPPHLYVTASIADTVRDLCSKATAIIDPCKDSPTRVWKIKNGVFNGSLYPSFRLHQDSAEVLIPSDQTLEEAMIEHDSMVVIEFLHNGSFVADSESILPSWLINHSADIYGQKHHISPPVSAIMCNFLLSTVIELQSLVYSSPQLLMWA
jgi:hypothetical protein